MIRPASRLLLRSICVNESSITHPLTVRERTGPSVDSHHRQLRELARRAPAHRLIDGGARVSLGPVSGRRGRQRLARLDAPATRVAPPWLAFACPAGQRRVCRRRQRRLAGRTKPLAADPQSRCGDRRGIPGPGLRAARRATRPIRMGRRGSSASACATPTVLPRARSESSLTWPGPSGSSSYRAPAGNTRPVGEFIPGPVDWVTGACMLVNSAMITALGGMDEDFFLYYEEVAFSQVGPEPRLASRVRCKRARGPPTSLAKSGDFAQDAGHHPAQQAALFLQALAALAVFGSGSDRTLGVGRLGVLVEITTASTG